MIIEIPYNRVAAVEYARRWALSRNPLFTDFTGRGGNCTNFVSQCVYAGCGVMNYTPTFGWYYISEGDRAPAWSGVDEFYNFITGAPEFSSINGGTGPFGNVTNIRSQIALGDVIQLANSSDDFYHTLIISGFTADDILVCAHSNDALDRPLSSYNYTSLRIIHIEGAMLSYGSPTFFSDLINGIALSTSEARKSDTQQNQ